MKSMAPLKGLPRPMMSFATSRQVFHRFSREHLPFFDRYLPKQNTACSRAHNGLLQSTYQGASPRVFAVLQALRTGRIVLPETRKYG